MNKFFQGISSHEPTGNGVHQDRGITVGWPALLQLKVPLGSSDNGTKPSRAALRTLAIGWESLEKCFHPPPPTSPPPRAHHNNNNRYLEHLACTGPKCLHFLNVHVFKIQCIQHTHAHTHAHTHPCTHTHARTHTHACMHKTTTTTNK